MEKKVINELKKAIGTNPYWTCRYSKKLGKLQVYLFGKFVVNLHQLDGLEIKYLDYAPQDYQKIEDLVHIISHNLTN